MNTDRILAWAGLTIGLLGLIPIFVSTSWQLRLGYIVALGLLVILFLVLSLSGKGPQYTTLAMKKTLVMVKEDGSLAQLKREQKIKINYGNMSEIWCRSIVADGSVRNIKIDDLEVQEEDKKHLGCLLDIRKKFPRSLYKSEEQAITWSYDLLNSFPANREFIDNDVTPSTRTVELIVQLPQSRPCKDAWLEEKVAGEPSKPLNKPTVDVNRTILRAVVKRPKAGSTIRLTWDW